MLTAGTIFTGCESNSGKTESNPDQTQKSMNDDEGLQHMGTTMMAGDTIMDYQNFKNVSENKIIAFEKSIAQLKVKIAAGEKDTREEYSKQLASLEQKNKDMKKKLGDYKEDGKDKGAQFRNEFNHDMDELGKAIEGLTLKTV